MTIACLGWGICVETFPVDQYHSLIGFNKTAGNSEER